MADIVFDGEFYKSCIEHFSDRESREIIYETPGVSVFPAIGKKVLLIIELVPILGRVIKLPGGCIDGSWNGIEYCCSESHEQAAQRELFEETGYKARGLDLLFKGFGNASIRQNQSLYIGWDCYKSNKERRIDSSEKIEVVPTPIVDAVNMAWNSEFYEPHNYLVLLAGRKLGFA